MAKKSNLATVLKADLATNIPLKMLAEMVRSQGRGRDTVLAHITPREAAKLKREGGSGTTNPVTGLPEFAEGDFSYADVGGGYQYPTTYGGQPSGFAPEALPPSDVSAAGGVVKDESRFTPAPSVFDTGAPAQWGPFQAVQYDPYAVQAAYTSPQAAPAVATVAPPTDVAAQQVFGPSDAISKAYAPLTTESVQAAVKGTTEPNWLQTALGKIDPLKALITAGGLGFGLYGRSQALKQAADLQAQYQAAADKQKAFAEAQRTLAQPLLTQGAQMVGLSAQGALTAARQQQFDAYRARVAQEASRQGGAVAAAQVGAVEERARQDSLQAQQTAGLQLFGTGTSEYNLSVQQDNAALQTQLQGLNANVQISQAANAAATNFFTNLAYFIVPSAQRTPTQSVNIGGQAYVPA